MEPIGRFCVHPRWKDSKHHCSWKEKSRQQLRRARIWKINRVKNGKWGVEPWICWRNPSGRACTRNSPLANLFMKIIWPHKSGVLEGPSRSTCFRAQMWCKWCHCSTDPKLEEMPILQNVLFLQMAHYHASLLSFQTTHWCDNYLKKFMHKNFRSYLDQHSKLLSGLPSRYLSLLHCWLIS